MAELLIGCGNSRKKMICPAGADGWSDLTTLDIDPNCGADVEWDIERLPLPFPDEKFDEIHAYHTLEHVGRQGDYRFFFAQFSEFWRLLKPQGKFCGIVPAPGSRWVWGDPGHTRFLPPEWLAFLAQPTYDAEAGYTEIADYRFIYRADFALMHLEVGGKVMTPGHPQEGKTLPNREDDTAFVLVAVKPSRISI